MLGTTWFSADKNRVQKLIVQSGDAFWNPGGIDHEHCGDGFPKCPQVMELGRKYTGVDHTKKGKVVLTAPLPQIRTSYNEHWKR